MRVEKTLGGLHAFLYEVVARIYPDSIPPVLDIGCGSGAWLKRLQNKVSSPGVGIDYVQPPDVSGLELKSFGINADSASGVGRHSLVTRIEVIEHIENIGRLLDVIHAPLAPGGVALIKIPNIESLRARVRALASGKIPSFNEKSDPTHLMPILRDSLQKMLECRGMVIVETPQLPPERTSSLQCWCSVVWGARMAAVVLADSFYGDTAVHLTCHKS